MFAVFVGNRRGAPARKCQWMFASVPAFMFELDLQRPSGSAHFRSFRVQVSNAREGPAVARDRVKLPGLVLPASTQNLQRFPHRVNLTPQLQVLQSSASNNNKQQRKTRISLLASPTLQTITPTRQLANQTTQHQTTIPRFTNHPPLQPPPCLDYAISSTNTSSPTTTPKKKQPPAGRRRRRRETAARPSRGPSPARSCPSPRPTPSAACCSCPSGSSSRSSSTSCACGSCPRGSWRAWWRARR